MAKPYSLQNQPDMDSSCVNLLRRLLWDVYQYFFNLPFIVFALMTCQDYHIVQPPMFSYSFVSLVNVFLLPFAVIDLLSEAIVDVLEVSYSAILYHIVYTGAAIGCLIVGDYANLAEVKDWMDSCYLQEEQQDQKILNDVDEKNLYNETDKVPIKIDYPPTEEIAAMKDEKTIVPKKDESGYLTEGDLEVEG